MRKITTRMIGVLLLLSLVRPMFLSTAQGDIPVARRVLVSGVDINGQGFPLVMIYLDEQRPETLATFANRPICPAVMYPEGAAVLYELWDASGQPYTYRVDVAAGTRTLLEEPTTSALTCPRIAPEGSEIAWYRRNDDDTMSIILSDADLQNQRELIRHDEISGLRWSPGGAALIYLVQAADRAFPTLMSLPRQGGTTPRVVFDAQNGLFHDFMWTEDSSGLLVAYYTESDLSVALLSASCVIGPGDPCEIEPIAAFPFDYSLTLLDTQSLLGRQALASVQYIEDGVLQGDLWTIDLERNLTPQQLTSSADILETDAHFAPDVQSIYFIGTRFDDASQTLRGAIYQLSLDENGTEPNIVFESNVFSPSQFLWWYE